MSVFSCNTNSIVIQCCMLLYISQQPWCGADAGMKGASDGNPEPSKIPHLSGLERALHASATATNSTFSILKDSHQLGLEIVLHALTVTPATNSAFPMFTPPVPLLLFVCLVFTCMPGESYHRWLRSLLCLCDSFWALINSLICWLHKQSNSAISITTAPFLIFWILFQCKLMCFMNR